MTPGPPAVQPGLAPGGVVLQVYDDTGYLVLEQLIPDGDDLTVRRLALEAADVWLAHAHRGVGACLVAFDGDTGERFPRWAWEQF